jgi:hypothetical protein
MNPHPHSSLGAREDFGHLAVRQQSEHMQIDRNPLSLRQEG